MNPLQNLIQYGQSVWLDFIRRSLMSSGELARLVREDGLRGMTSNPAIFEKAVADSADYQDLLQSPECHTLPAKDIFERLAIRDIQDAADALRSLYEESRWRDGYVSLEVAPTLAHDTAGTIEEAKRLWAAVNRPNLMIKVPATPAGIPAIQTLSAAGINVTVTLLCDSAAYEETAAAYLAGLEQALAAGHSLARIASVASFFISRIDSAVDKQLQNTIASTTDAARKSELQALLGQTAIANAKVTYQRYGKIYSGARWEKLAAQGAQTQRLLWASTGTKNPAYRDVVYVEELIGPDTVHTIPPATYDAFRDHGQLRSSLTENVAGAEAVLAALPQAGVSLKDVTDQLLVEGVQLFVDAFAKLLSVIEKARDQAR
ncbi:MAG: transaldolase [Planctomycetota bacterium]